MKKATLSDMSLVVNIIAETFDNNPGVNWLIKSGVSHKKYIRRLAQYAFIKSYLRNGVFLSSNEKGVALFYKFNYKKFSIRERWYQLKFALTSISLYRLPSVLKREAYRNKMRPASGEYYYFWFFAVLPNGSGAGFELKNALFELASKDNLPIYVETTLERNKKIYERAGFTTYHYWEDKEDDIKFWFLKWESPGAKSDLHAR